MAGRSRAHQRFSSAFVLLLSGAGSWAGCTDSKQHQAVSVDAGIEEPSPTGGEGGSATATGGSGGGSAVAGAGGLAGAEGLAGAGGLAGAAGTGATCAGTIESYCSSQAQGCPTLSEVRASVRENPRLDMLFVLPCHAADGSPRVVVEADELYGSTIYRFDAAGTLVAIGFTSFEWYPCPLGYSRYYGETGGDCKEAGWGGPPPGCPELQADAGYECVLTDAGAGG